MIGNDAEIDRRSVIGAAAMLGAAAASRGAMAWLWSALPTADRGGLADRVGRPGPAAGRRAALLGAALLVLAGTAAGVLGTGEGTSLEAAAAAAAARGAGAALLGLALALLVLFRLAGILMRRLGGQTGDALGAAQQLTEIALLLGLALALP